MRGEMEKEDSARLGVVEGGAGTGYNYDHCAEESHFATRRGTPVHEQQKSD